MSPRSTLPPAASARVAPCGRSACSVVDSPATPAWWPLAGGSRGRVWDTCTSGARALGREGETDRLEGAGCFLGDVFQFHNELEEPVYPTPPIRIALDDNTKFSVSEYRDRLYKEIVRKKKEIRRRLR